MSPKWKSRIIKISRDFAIIVVVLIAIDFWQRRNLLSSDSPWSDAEIVTSSTLNTIEGHKEALLADDRLNFVYFFAPWCEVCALSISNIHKQASKENVGESVNFRFVVMDYESIETVNAFINEHKILVPVLLGDSRLRKKFKIEAYPTYYLIDPAGKILTHAVGYSTSLGTILRLWWHQ